MKQSAGILLYKKNQAGLQVMLVHPGGPFWKNRNSGSWSIPKGEFTNDENPLEAALREFEEETGFRPTGKFIELTPVKLKSNKLVHAWACKQDLDVSQIVSNEFELEWPPKSGIIKLFPEVDKAEWFSIDEALRKINSSQLDFISQLLALPSSQI